VDDALLVRDETIIQGMCLLHRHVGVVAEPSGAVGVAAIIERPGMFRDRLIGTIVCRSNLTAEQMHEWL